MENFDINHNVFLNSSTKAKQKINKWDLLKGFCTARETINKTKRQPTDWEKLLANDMTYKELIFKTYKQLIQSNIYIEKKTKQITRLKMGRRLE